MIILTNNPKFKSKNDKFKISFLDTDYLGILKEGRKYIHQNYELLTHPLYGSVKPYETVYRTLILKKSPEISFSSVQLIEDAILTAEKFYEMNKDFKWTDDILDDFQIIDKDLIDNAIERIL